MQLNATVLGLVPSNVKRKRGEVLRKAHPFLLSGVSLLRASCKPACEKAMLWECEFVAGPTTSLSPQGTWLWHIINIRGGSLGSSFYFLLLFLDFALLILPVLGL